MQLYYSQTSPFARKVAMLLHFTGQIEQCELVFSTFNDEALREQNPLGKIPALVNDALVLFESDLICEYLDDLWCLDGNLSLIARGSQHYYLQQKAQAQANGVIEAAVNAALEKRRETEHSEHWLGRWETAIEQGLKTLDLEHCGTAEKPNMASFCLASALGYLDFRHPHLDWRSRSEELAHWHSKVEDCVWYRQTVPPAS